MCVARLGACYFHLGATVPYPPDLPLKSQARQRPPSDRTKTTRSLATLSNETRSALDAAAGHRQRASHGARPRCPEASCQVPGHGVRRKLRRGGLAPRPSTVMGGVFPGNDERASGISGNFQKFPFPWKFPGNLRVHFANVRKASPGEPPACPGLPRVCPVLYKVLGIR